MTVLYSNTGRTQIRTDKMPEFNLHDQTWKDRKLQRAAGSTVSRESSSGKAAQRKACGVMTHWGQECTRVSPNLLRPLLSGTSAKL